MKDRRQETWSEPQLKALLVDSKDDLWCWMAHHGQGTHSSLNVLAQAPVLFLVSRFLTGC